MKLRIHKDSLRFRLNRSEVESLYRGESLDERVAAGPSPAQSFAYRLVPTAAPEIACAALEGNALSVLVSQAAIEDWRNGTGLTIQATQTWDGGSVEILIEKDLQRLKPKPGEDESGAFPNPLFGKVVCDHP